MAARATARRYNPGVNQPDFDTAAREIARLLLPNTEAKQFRPHREWLDFGLLVEALEAQGLYLMTNSATKDGKVRRTASFHKVTGFGYPCVGSSEWGPFQTHGEAVVRAAYEALVKPRA
jgi:hypothetical protein